MYELCYFCWLNYARLVNYMHSSVQRVCDIKQTLYTPFAEEET